MHPVKSGGAETPHGALKWHWDKTNKELTPWNMK